MKDAALKLFISEIQSKKKSKSHRLDIHLDAILVLRAEEVSYGDIQKYLKEKGVQISFSGLRSFVESRMKRIELLNAGLPAPRPGRPKKSGTGAVTAKKSQQPVRQSPSGAPAKPNPFADASRKADREYFTQEPKTSIFDLETKNNK